MLRFKWLVAALVLVPGVAGAQSVGGDFIRLYTPGAGGTWGSITGTLADQTDLQTAMNLKLTSPAGTGFVVQTAAGTWATRSFASGDGSITVTNGDGVTGNVDLAVDPSVYPVTLAQGKLAGRGGASGSGVPEEIALGTGLSFSGTTLSASASFDPLDTATVWLRDEFGLGSTTSGAISQLGWTLTAIAGTGTVSTVVDGAFPHLTVTDFKTGATSGDGSALTLRRGASGAFPLGAVGATSGWDNKIVFKIPNSSNILIRIGFTAAAPAAEPIGIWLRYDTATDTNWQFCSRTGTTTTCYNSGTAADTNWHTLRIRSVTNAKVQFTLDAGTERTICAAGCDATATPDTGVMDAYLSVQGVGAGAKELYLDLWAFQATGLSR